MKKRIKRKKMFPDKPEGEFNIAETLLKIQQQLTFLEKKMDSLIGKSPERPFGEQRSQAPAQSYGQSSYHSRPDQDNRFRERVFHKATCADCKKECEVPFKPTGDRPVYCKECFSKRKKETALTGPNDDSRKPYREPGRERHFDKRRGGSSSGGGRYRRSSEGKKPEFRKRRSK